MAQAEASLRAEANLLPLSLLLLAHGHSINQKKSDPIRDMWLELRDHQASKIDVGSMTVNWNIAKEGNATLIQRFKFAAMVVIAFDNHSVSTSQCKRFAKEATGHLKAKELTLSPTYCYVVARLGLIHLKISAFETEAANRYYSSSKGGVSANILARVLSFNSSAAARAQSLTYALEAQAKQKDSVKLRWLVGGAYLFKADFTKERQYYEASIREYKCAIELAKAGKDKDFSDGNLETIRFYLEKAKDGLSKLKG